MTTNILAQIAEAIEETPTYPQSEYMSWGELVVDAAEHPENYTDATLILIAQATEY